MTPLANMVAFPHSHPSSTTIRSRTSCQWRISRRSSSPRHRTERAGEDLGRIRGTREEGRRVRQFLLGFDRQPSPHFFGLLFAKAAGLNLNYIPYKGTAQILPALMAGEIPAAVLPINEVGALMQSGNGRMLATSGGKRSPQYPDVPTFKESGYDIEGSRGTQCCASRHAQGDRRACARGDRRHRSPGCEAALEPLGVEITAWSRRAGDHPEVDYDKWGPAQPRLGFQADQ